eukprot:1430441-Alexandrium_andersonii.AAC.1
MSPWTCSALDRPVWLSNTRRHGSATSQARCTVTKLSSSPTGMAPNLFIPSCAHWMLRWLSAMEGSTK